MCPLFTTNGKFGISSLILLALSLRSYKAPMPRFDRFTCVSNRLELLYKLADDAVEYIAQWLLDYELKSSHLYYYMLLYFN